MLAEESLRDQPKLHLYGHAAALCFEATYKKDGFATINIDVAPKPDRRQVDWSQKITLQLSSTELVTMTGIFFGFTPKAHFARPDKGIQIERQPGKVYLSASAGSGRIYGLPLTPGDVVRAADFFIARIVEMSLTKDVSAAIASVRGACALLN